MPRRTTTSIGSLELLLDTICNTFGGIIFLAILVALLLQISGPTGASPSSDPATLREANLNLARVQEELDDLKRVVGQQDQMIEKMARPGDSAPTESVAELKQRHAELIAQRQQAADALQAIESKQTSERQQSDSLDASVRQLRERIAELERQIKDEMTARAREAKLPVLRGTKKQEMPVFLKQGRFTRLFRTRARDLNTSEVEVQALGTGRGTARPKPGMGILIRRGGGSRDQLVAALAGYNKDANYLAIFVWPDSFDVFAELRTVIVAQGFEYRLAPLPDEVDVIREGGGAALVQ